MQYKIYVVSIRDMFVCVLGIYIQIYAEREEGGGRRRKRKRRDESIS